MATLYENYNSGDDEAHASQGNFWHAQTFTTSAGHTTSSVKLKVYRTGSPGTITVSIRAVDEDGKPTGSDLATGTTDGDTLTTSSIAEWREITFVAAYSLVIDTQYAIATRALSGSSGNTVNWRDVASGSYTGGRFRNSSNGGTTWGDAFAATDFMFEVWGDPIAPTVTTQSMRDVVGVTATGQGNITDLGSASVTAHGHCWGTSVDPTTADSSVDNGAKTSTGAFTSAIANLTPGTGYYTRAFATNSEGTSYGANVYFVASTDRAGYTWMEGSNFRGFDENAIERKYIHTDDVDDTAVNGEIEFPISSNWAYDHVAAADPHTGYVLESLFDAKGDIIAASADNTPAKVTVGANNEYIVAASGETAGIKWQTIPATDVEVSELPTATYDDVQDYINFFGDRTLLSGGAITDNGDGTVAIDSLTGWCKETDSDTAVGKFFDFAGGNTAALTDVTTNYVYVDYNGGTPQLVVSTSLLTHGFKQDHILIGTCFRDGTKTHFHQVSTIGIGRINRSDMHHREEDPVHRATGIVTSSVGTRNLGVTTGVLYEGNSRHTTLPFTTPNAGTADDTEANTLHDADGGFATTDVGKTVHNTTDDTYATVTAFVDSGQLTLDADIFISGENYDLDIFSYWYTSDSGSTWTEVNGSTAISNSQYNNIASGLASLTANRYGVHWVYMEVDGEHFHAVYGQGNYKVNEAEEATPPSILPDVVVNYSVLIAKIICQEGTDTLTILFPWTTVFTSTLATDHGSLGGLTDDDHTQYIRHALATAANDFLVASGSGAYVKKTLAETLALISPLTTRGDIMFRNATVNARLAKGTQGYPLVMGANEPQWGGGITLNGTLTLGGQVFDAGSGDAEIDTTGASKGLIIKSGYALSGGVRVQLYHNSATPAINDDFGQVSFIGNTLVNGGNPADTNIQYGDFLCRAVAVLDEAESAWFRWRLMNAGSLDLAMTLNFGGDLTPFGFIQINDTKKLRTGGIDDDYFTIDAHDNDDAAGTVVEIARALSATDPEFQIGNNGNVLRGSRAGLLGFFNVAPQSQPAHIVDADGTLGDITTKFNQLLADMATLGLQAAA
ncbi:hypothetical protein LCGC14_0387820 [marine sediment metagenome]|uniref:Uncharacterized protein n=1 Tax=marine sediment metagenome TaxID=412755 RepID=A0A0F9T0H6_9ZZZZ